MSSSSNMQIEQAAVDVNGTNQVKVPTRAAISLMLAEIKKAIDTGVPLTNKRAVRIAAKLASPSTRNRSRNR